VRRRSCTSCRIGRHRANRRLLPTRRFVEALTTAGFHDIAAIEVTPVHVVVHGTK